MSDNPVKSLQIGQPCQTDTTTDMYELWIGFDGTEEFDMLTPDEALTEVNYWQRVIGMSGREAYQTILNCKPELHFPWPQLCNGSLSEVFSLDLYYYDCHGVKYHVDLIKA